MGEASGGTKVVVNEPVGEALGGTMAVVDGLMSEALVDSRVGCLEQVQVALHAVFAEWPLYPGRRCR